MKTVWKYPIELLDEQVVQMPANAHILTVQLQFAQLCLWALVNPSMPLEGRKIIIAGTGHEREILDGFVQYISTFQLRDGHLVFHVFEHLTYAAVAPSEEMAEAALTTSG